MKVKKIAVFYGINLPVVLENLTEKLQFLSQN